jgi:hypothetical protein
MLTIKYPFKKIYFQIENTSTTMLEHFLCKLCLELLGNSLVIVSKSYDSQEFVCRVRELYGPEGFLILYNRDEQPAARGPHAAPRV